jgi:hypothetical protein
MGLAYCAARDTVMKLRSRQMPLRLCQDQAFMLVSGFSGNAR